MRSYAITAESFLSQTPDESGRKSANAQALRVFTELQTRLKNDPNLKIGILYSANDIQARIFHETYLYNPNLNDNEEIRALPELGENVGGQAIFFRELIKLINANKMAEKIHILPIATSLRGGSDKSPSNRVSLVEINRDLIAIEHHLNYGFAIYGIPGNPKVNGRYSIGGGYSEEFVNAKCIQHGNRVLTRGEYLQEQLIRLEEGNNLDLLDDNLCLLDLKPKESAQQSMLDFFSTKPKSGELAEPLVQAKKADGCCNIM
ncbi:MAG: hypothetical protein KBD83_02690 [Gammaproteobacteria bacterium]|nr:hypothetical protein [Gammaproteobacteria bacterium]